jgi:hypothetical protein
VHKYKACDCGEDAMTRARSISPPLRCVSLLSGDLGIENSPYGQGRGFKEGVVRERFLECDACMVEFSIKVEPTKSDEEVNRLNKESVEWLSLELSCPVCNGPLYDK